MAVGEADRREGGDAFGEGGRDLLVERAVAPAEVRVSGPEGDVPLRDLDPLVGLPDALHVHTEPEAVQQLRPQLPLLRVHGPHQDEARRVHHRHPLPLHHVDPHRRRVQQHVHDVVVQQVHLVHVEDVPVGLRQHPRLEALGALLQRRLQVDGAHHPVLRGVDRQLHHPHPPGRHRQRVLAAAQPVPAVDAEMLGLLRVAAEVTAHDHALLGQEAGQRTYGGRLPGPPFSPNEHAPHTGVDRVQAERELHALLTHDGAEGKRMPRVRDH